MLYSCARLLMGWFRGVSVTKQHVCTCLSPSLSHQETGLVSVSLLMNTLVWVCGGGGVVACSRQAMGGGMLGKSHQVMG